MFSGCSFAAFVRLFVRSFVRSYRSCYHVHDISWTVWAISLKLTANIYYPLLIIVLDSGGKRSTVKVTVGHLSDAGIHVDSCIVNYSSVRCNNNRAVSVTAGWITELFVLLDDVWYHRQLILQYIRIWSTICWTHQRLIWSNDGDRSATEETVNEDIVNFKRTWEISVFSKRMHRFSKVKEKTKEREPTNPSPIVSVLPPGLPTFTHCYRPMF